ncbi:hypothetical protein CsSME_00017100 [Camellia sinensis var. sinensis]
MSSRKKFVFLGPSESALMKERDVPPASEWRKSPYFVRKDPFWRAATSTTSLSSPKGGLYCVFLRILIPSMGPSFPHLRCYALRLSEGLFLTTTPSSRLSPTLPLVSKNGSMMSSRAGAFVRGFRRPDY